LLFGSDGPWLHPGLELHKVRLLGLPPAAEALVLGGNALRLLRGARRQPLTPARPRAARPATEAPGPERPFHGVGPAPALEYEL
jgi:hypothetical protein